jgi:hypothetical protein
MHGVGERLKVLGELAQRLVQKLHRIHGPFSIS